MGLMGQLKFAFFCIDFLAWPVIALAYPLSLSIRAIETGSNYHMKKLVIYWTLFSLISLFEYAFVKIIEWVPFWSVIKLIAIFWLAIPRFHGACYAYKCFVRPLFVVKLQELISRLDEQGRANKEIFIDVANKHIEDNGFQGLEKLIATKKNRKEGDSCHQDTQIIESNKKNDEATSKQVQTVTNSNLVTKETTYAAVVTKGILGKPPTQTIPVIRKPAAIPVTPHSEKLVQQEWTCPLCRVTTTCENNLNMHLRGKKHGAMVESLKSTKETCIQVADTHIEENGLECLEKLITTKRNCKEARDRDTQLIESNKENDEVTSKQVKDNEISEASEENVVTEVAKQVQPVTTSNLVTKGILGTSPEQTYAAAVTKGILGTSPEKIFPVIRNPVAKPVTSRPKKLFEQEWTCTLCEVTTTCEKNLNMHLCGKKHKAMVEDLKSTKLNAMEAGPGKSAGSDKGGVSRHFCFVCDVLVGGASLASHLNGKRHASNIAKNGIN